MGRNATGVHSAAIEITGDTRNRRQRFHRPFLQRHRDKYTVYFAAEFSRPFTSFGTWNGASVNEGPAIRDGPGTGGWVGFDTTTKPEVVMSVALSYVSVANARDESGQGDSRLEF